MDIARQEMPTQDPAVRRTNYDEVALGFTPELAQREADRCLQCKKPQCVEGCPVGVLIPEFIKTLREGDIEGSIRAMKEKNNLPAICGRVCPQETQCEVKCVLGKKGEPVAIGRLERYIGDYELAHRTCPLVRPESTDKRVAIVGTGPAGLTCAVDLGRQGHEVVMFESLHSPGGVLVYGIPEFRLPKGVVHAEIDYAAECLGIQVRTDAVIGRLYTVDELLNEEGFDAIFLGTGAGLPSFMRIPGINYNGVLSANEFLTRVNLMKAYLFPQYDTPVKIGKRVAVIGGGNVAMDSARCALRLGADRVYIVYRRSEAEMPARREEVENAMEEGIEFKLLTNPKQFLGDDKNWVVGMECHEMELGEPDESGRRRPVVKEGSEFVIDVDEVIVALGTRPNPLIASTTPGLETTRHGTVVADEETGKTVKDKVWAGGDIVTGAATVISAMGAGKRAAADIDEYLRG